MGPQGDVGAHGERADDRSAVGDGVRGRAANGGDGAGAEG